MLFGYTDAIQLRGGGDVIHAYLLPVALLLIAWAVWLLIRRAQGKSIVGALWRLGLAAAVLVWFAFTKEVPPEFTNMTPYIATLLVLAFSAQRLRMPAADGQIYRKGEAN
jgi:simple sugar transport system permease protein